MAGIKNLVSFATKFLNMAKSKTKAKKATAKSKSVKPVAKSRSKLVAKKSVKAIKKTVTKSKTVAKVAKKKAKAVFSKKAVVKPSKKTTVKQSKKATKAKPIAKKKVVTKSKVKPVKKVKVAKVKKVIKNKIKPTKVTKLSKKALANSFKERMQKQNALKPEKRQMYQTVVKVQTKQIGKKHVAIKDMNMRYSDEELKEFKELIDKKLVTARDELKYLKEALDNHNDNQAGSKAWNMAERSDTSEMETLMNQISRQHQYLRNLALAFVRVTTPTSGICRLTGKLIPKERLRIVPHATLSLEAKMNRKAEDANPNTAATAIPSSDFAEGFED